MTVSKQERSVATPAAPPPEQPKGSPFASTDVTVDPRLVSVDVSGLCTRQLFVRLPANFTTEHLREPSLWRRVQGSDKSLKRFDRLVMTTFTEDQYITAVVNQATSDSVTLSAIRIDEMSVRLQALPQDDKFIGEWVGSGYRLKRRSDNVYVSSELPTIAALEVELKRMYATRVGAAA